MRYVDTVMLEQEEAEAKMRHALEALGIPGMIDGQPAARLIIQHMLLMNGDSKDKSTHFHAHTLVIFSETA